MDENVTPLESNLEWTVSFDLPNRNFIGRAALETLKQNGIKRKLVGLIMGDKSGIPRSHQKVVVPDIGEGETTSGGFSPSLGVGIALARVPIGIRDDCFIVIRDQKIPAKVIKPPFVRNGKKVCMAI